MTAKKSVAFFVTCLIDQLLPEIGRDAVKLLRHAGFAVHFPPAQTCCGQPFYNSGFILETERLARQTIEMLEPYPQIVLPGGSCTAMIRHEYPRLFAGDPHWHDRAAQLAAKTMELTEFLVYSGIEFPRTRENETVTYHDSCHMHRVLGVDAAPRELLQRAGYTLVEMEESDRCCGFGGLFSVRMPEVSNQMTAVKLQHAAGAGGRYLVTADAGCLQQMRGMAAAEMEIVHVATLLAAALP